MRIVTLQVNFPEPPPADQLVGIFNRNKDILAMQSTLFFPSALLLTAILQVHATAQQTQPALNCPDDGTQTFSANNTGQDKIFTADPNGQSDKTYVIEVVSGGTVIDSIEVDDGQPRSITVPNGASPRVRDPQDDDGKKVEGRATW